MFPGLAWGGEIDGQTSESFFVREFGALLRSVTRPGLHVRSMDATFTGTALLRMLKVIYEAFSSLGERVDGATVTIAVVVDASRARKAPADDLIELQTECGRLFIQRPSGFTPTAPLDDRSPCEFKRNDGQDLYKLQVEFHVLPTIPTEDRAEVIGVCGVHSDLTVEAVRQFGRIMFAFENGRSSIGTGGNGIGSNILNWLSKDETQIPWSEWLTTSLLPPMTEDELAFTREAECFLLSGLRNFELSHSTTIQDALAGLQAKEGLLTCDEIHYLVDVAHEEFQETGVDPTWISRNLQRKAIASALKDAECSDTVLELLRVCNLRLAAGEPKGSVDKALKWWKDQIPRE
jgi:hypothetical protein